MIRDIYPIQESKFYPQNLLIGPHQNKEYELMMSNRKPVSLVDKSQESFENLMKATDKGKLIYRKINILSGGTKVRDHSYGFAHIGNEGKLERMQEIFDQVHEMGDFSDELHIELGQLLGYSNREIREFIKGRR